MRKENMLFIILAFCDCRAISISISECRKEKKNALKKKVIIGWRERERKTIYKNY